MRDINKEVRQEPYLSSPEKRYMDSIDPLDAYGFEVQPAMHWLYESHDNELKRLEMNQFKFKEFVKCGTRFPAKINKEREAEFIRIQQINQIR